MAKDTGIRMPSGMGGLVRYFDEYKSKIEFKPGYILILAVIIIILILLLHQWGGGLLAAP